jgi:hypothetical protein
MPFGGIFAELRAIHDCPRNFHASPSRAARRPGLFAVDTFHPACLMTTGHPNPYLPPSTEGPAKPTPAARKPWFWIALLVAGAGVGVILAGVLYGVMVMGVPDPGAPPVVNAARLSSAMSLSAVGVVLMVAGLLWAGGLLLARSFRKPERGDPSRD